MTNALAYLASSSVTMKESFIKLTPVVDVIKPIAIAGDAIN
jgi:hypothetical protein